MSSDSPVFLDRPVFFVGMPRSGTTILFELFARHEALGWLSNYCQMWPRQLYINALCPLLDNKWIRLRGNKKQYGKVLLGNRYLPQPAEAYAFWNYYTSMEFSKDYLLGVSPPPKVRDKVITAVGKVLAFQRKHRFATKLTGPGRIHFLNAIFPDALFINVIRDGRPVVDSLLRVPFWKEKGGFERPFWKNGLPESELATWEASGRDPAVLAALQWAYVVSSTRQEANELAASRYMEVKYEDFVLNPESTMRRLLEFCGLPHSKSIEDVDYGGVDVRNMNTKYTQASATPVVSRATEAMQPMLHQLGYS